MVLLINMNGAGKEWGISGTERRAGTEDFEGKKICPEIVVKARSIGLRQRRRIKDEGPKHRDARLIYGQRRACKRRTAKGKQWQEFI